MVTPALELEGRVLDLRILGDEEVVMEIIGVGQPRTMRVPVDRRNNLDIVRIAREISNAYVKFKEEVFYGQPRDSRGRGGYNSKRTCVELEIMDGLLAGAKYVSDTTKVFGMPNPTI